MYGLSDTTISDLRLVFIRHANVREVVIFGSRAKGEYREGSDIDLAVIADNLTYNQLMDMMLEIDDLGLLYKVDLIDYNKNKDNPIGEHIRRVGKTFYKAA
ncbi:MAG: nucleotidyltransferase domain-containing protein [Bacteroidales bacterium]|nr:nucleotidyltransferase domain-containing protein [Bacteroidales bacterium]